MKLIDAFMDMAIPMMRVDPSQRNLGAKWEALKAALRNRHLKPEIMALIGSPAYVSIIERFEHPITQSAMCALLGAAGPITNEATGIYFALLGFIHRFGLGRAVGGMQTLSNALAARLTELGGEILLSTQIKEIVAEGGRAIGVRLPDGSLIRAQAVVASIHPKMALEMVTPGALDRRLLTRIALAPANGHGASPLKVTWPCEPRCNTVGTRRCAPMASACANACILLVPSTRYSRTSAVHPVAKYRNCPICGSPRPVRSTPAKHLKARTSSLYPVAMPVEPREGWDAIRAQVGQQVIDQASGYMDGLKEFEIGRRIEAAPILLHA
jgi:phytoene dehydrogenase-like protein